MKQSGKAREHGGRSWKVIECHGRTRKDMGQEVTLNESSGMAWKEREHCGKGWNPMEGSMKIGNDSSDSMRCHGTSSTAPCKLVYKPDPPQA